MKLDSTTILNLLNTALPAVLAIYKEFRAQNPNEPMLTDDQIFALLALDSQNVIDRANEWLEAHPNAPTV